MSVKYSVRGKMPPGHVWYADNLAIPIPEQPRMPLADVQTMFPGIVATPFEGGMAGDVTMRLGTVLDEFQGDISGAQYRCRIQPRSGKYCGLEEALWLEANQEEFPDIARLPEWLYHIDFPRTPMVDRHGRWYVPCLGPKRGHRVLKLRPMSAGLTVQGRIAIYA
jgi:hypothetical protein